MDKQRFMTAAITPGVPSPWFFFYGSYLIWVALDCLVLYWLFGLYFFSLFVGIFLWCYSSLVWFIFIGCGFFIFIDLFIRFYWLMFLFLFIDWLIFTDWCFFIFLHLFFSFLLIDVFDLYFFLNHFYWLKFLFFSIYLFMHFSSFVYSNMLWLRETTLY